MTVSYINPQASHLTDCWGLMCISLSGGRSIPTEEFVSPSKFLVNSWPKSKFSWSKQLLVSNIQKISLKRRDQIKAIRQNKTLHYSMSAEVFQKLKITVMFAAKSLGIWQEHIHAYPELHDILIFLSYCDFNRYHTFSLCFGQRISQVLEEVLQFPWKSS